MSRNGVLIGMMITLHQTIVLMCKAILLPILKVPRRVLTASSVAAVGSAARTTALLACGASTVLASGAAMLASAWLGALEFTHFGGEVEQLRAQRKLPECQWV